MEKSVVHLLLKSIQNFPDKDVLQYKQNGSYRGITYRDFGTQIEVLTHALQATGLQPGDCIAILSYNRPEWPLSDFAVFSMRGITVPIYHTLPPNQISYILNDCGARAIFVENQLQYDKIRQIRNACPNLEFVFSFSSLSDDAHEAVPWDQLLKLGEEHRRKTPHFYRNSLEQIDPAATCSIVYTSGTTGNPKGVMLHHRGFVLDIINSEGVFGIYADDVFLSFLPLSHLYERLGGHWCPMYRGATIGYAEDITTVIDDIQQVRPTVMVSVPRLYEKINTAVMEQVERGSALKKFIFFWALKNGREYQRRKRTNTLNGWISSKNNLAEKLVFNKIKQKLGGRFRFPISGGAPLSTETLKFFEAMGLHIIEGYGMTETHLIITLTPPGSTKYGSCGKPIPDVQVKIAEDSEILVQGETVMTGYYRDPEQTSEIIDENGWLHTGDMGYLDADNYLYITDRKKNIIVTAGGKNVAPAPIENTLRLSRYIEDACVIGDRRKFISAIIMPDYEMLKRWAMDNDIPFESQEELVNRPDVEKLLMKEIERLQAEEARYEKVKKIILLTQPLTVEKGEITPSLKIRRKVVEEKFRQEIDRLYAEN